MTDQDYDAMRRRQSEAICKDYFGVKLKIDDILYDDIETGKGSYCILFRTNRHDVYALYIAKQPQTLRSVRRIVRSMGLVAESYAAPYGNRLYFKKKGFEIFKQAYPGRTRWTKQEEAFYQTLADYSPALVKIAKIYGEVRRYNPNYNSNWQKVLDLRYEKMKVTQQ